MCKLCICRHLLQSPNSKPLCPVCSKEFTGLSEVRTLSSGLLRILSKLEIHCDHLECKVTVPLDKLQEHVTRCSPTHASRVLVVSSPCESPQSTPGPSNQSTPRSEQSHLSPQTPLTPSKVSLQSVLDSPLDRTPTKAERAVASNLVRRMLNKSERGDSVELPTGGQV